MFTRSPLANLLIGAGAVFGAYKLYERTMATTAGGAELTANGSAAGGAEMLPDPEVEEAAPPKTKADEDFDPEFVPISKEAATPNGLANKALI